MATQAQVEASLRLQLQQDSPQRLQQAGANWKKAPMGFYYGTNPNSEISIDIAIKATMLRVLQADNATLPAPIFAALANMINSNTLAGAAIVIMTQAAAHEIPLPLTETASFSSTFKFATASTSGKRAKSTRSAKAAKTSSRKR